MKIRNKKKVMFEHKFKKGETGAMGTINPKYKLKVYGKMK